MSRRPLFRSALTAGLLTFVSLSAASSALAADQFNPADIPASERGTTPEQLNHCAKIEIVYARGTAEPAFNSWALNGYNYTLPNPSGSSHNSPYSIWRTVTRDLGNRFTPAGEREYYIKYPESAGAALKGRSDFVLYNLPYPADTTFLTNPTASGSSAHKGTVTLINHLNAENARCPEKKFMLFGFSQGALIVANIAALPSQRKYTYGTLPTLWIDTLYAISSVGMLSDAGFNSTESITTYGHNEYNRVKFGSATIPLTSPWNIDANTKVDLNGRRLSSNITLSGVMRGQLDGPGAGPDVGLRSNNWTWTPFIDRIRSYCYAADPICNRSSTQTEAHLYYFNDSRPRQELAIFAVRRLRADDPRWAGSPLGSGYPGFWATDTGLTAP